MVASIVHAEATVDALGFLTFMFTRQGTNASSVMRSAGRDVLRALPGARLVEAAPDFVGIREASTFLGMSRQAMRKWVMLRGSNFPAPVHAASGVVWHLAEILEWMQAARRVSVDPELIEVARVARELNLRVDIRRHKEGGCLHPMQAKPKGGGSVEGES